MWPRTLCGMPLLQAALNGDRDHPAVPRAVREVCPGIPISLSTSAEIEPDPGYSPSWRQAVKGV